MKVLLIGEPKRGAHLWAVLNYSGAEILHIPTDATEVEQQIMDDSYDVIILRKNYSAIGEKTAERIRDVIEKGTGLLMVGGWSTYTGRDLDGIFTGGYKGTPIEEALPVSLLDHDDRVNETLFFMINDRGNYHSIFGDDMPDYNKAVCGCNQVEPKLGSTTVLNGVQASYSKSKVTLSGIYPILVMGKYGKGKTAAYTSDLGPHWAGNIVDWQMDKTDRTAVSPGFELGNLYIKFCYKLIEWLALS